MKSATIVCLGDSITWGYPYGPQYSWVELSQKALGLNMINRGVNGDTAGDLKNRFNRDVLRLNPSHLIIMVGTNDASIGLSLGEYSGYMKKMYSDASSRDIQVIIGLPIPSTDQWLEYTLEKYRFWLRTFAADQDLKVIDFSSAMKVDASNINHDCYSDDVHPSRFGYQAISDHFIKWGRQVFQI